MKIALKHVVGLDFACNAMRYAFDSCSKMEERIESQGCSLWEDDVKLLSNLILSGDSHAKVARMINVYIEITAPRYFYQEFDTYRHGVEKSSQSTMHTITKRPLQPKDFQDGEQLPIYYINDLNELIKEKNWYRVKQRLPESFLQKRAICLNYQAIRHMYIDRKNHKLPEWHTFLDAMSVLPFYDEFIKIEKTT